MILTRVFSARKMLPAVITTNCLRSARRAVVVVVVHHLTDRDEVQLSELLKRLVTP